MPRSPMPRPRGASPARGDGAGAPRVPSPRPPHPVSAASTSATSRSRARATRDRIVPIATSQISAASAYEQPTSWVRTNATRWSRSRPSTSAWSECALVGSPVCARDATADVGPLLDLTGESPAAHRTPHGVGAGPTGDREQPGAGAGVASERGQGPPGAHEGLLGGVVGFVLADEVQRQAPDIGLARSDGLQQSRAVSVACLEPEPREVVHCAGRYWGNSGALVSD